MYEKMIQIDPNAPTEEEHQAKGKQTLLLLWLDFNIVNTHFLLQA